MSCEVFRIILSTDDGVAKKGLQQSRREKMSGTIECVSKGLWQKKIVDEKKCVQLVARKKIV